MDTIMLGRLSCLCLALGTTGAFAANVVSAPQGGVARWAGLAAKECGIHGKRYPAIDATCYYPVDIQTKPGAHEIALWDQDGKQHMGMMQVQDAQFPKVDMELPDSLQRYLTLSDEDKARAVAERKEIAKVLGGNGEPPQFSLPLAQPAANLPKSEDDFGSTRVFDAEHSSLHSGRDYPVGTGNAVKAVADGTVTLAGDHFFAGKSVYVDHGGGLVSMNFHLDEIAVADGEAVKRGQALGKIGSTGRATGPHLHLGLRWLGARIDPALLLGKPTDLPSVADSSEEAQQKIEKAEAKEPDEDDEVLDES
jgi:hypothetical protein